jgi:hypothetical protein
VIRLRYVVARVIHSPAGAVRKARLVVTDVPDKITTEDALAALTAAGKAAEFSEDGVPFGNHEIKRDGQRGWPYGISGIDEAPAITWEALTRTPTRGEGRRVTLRLTDPEFAAVTLAAKREGVSLQAWAMNALLAAAGAPSSPAAAPARAAK